MIALLDMLDEGTQNWRNELGHIADSAVAWQPFARGHNISALLLHMADVESRSVSEAVLGKPQCATTIELFGPDFFTASNGEWPKPMEASLDWHYAIQDAIRADTRLALSSRAKGDLIQHPRWGQISLGSLIVHLIQHEAYHAGQIALHKIHFGWGGVEPALAA